MLFEDAAKLVDNLTQKDTLVYLSPEPSLAR